MLLENTNEVIIGREKAECKIWESVYNPFDKEAHLHSPECICKSKTRIVVIRNQSNYVTQSQSNQKTYKR